MPMIKQLNLSHAPAAILKVVKRNLYFDSERSMRWGTRGCDNVSSSPRLPPSFLDDSVCIRTSVIFTGINHQHTPGLTAIPGFGENPERRRGILGEPHPSLLPLSGEGV